MATRGIAGFVEDDPRRVDILCVMGDAQRPCNTEVKQWTLRNGICEKRLVDCHDSVLRFHPKDKTEPRNMEFFCGERRTRIKREQCFPDRHCEGSHGQSLDVRLLSSGSDMLTKLACRLWIYVMAGDVRNQNVTPGCEYSSSLATSSILRSFRKIKLVTTS